MIKRVVVGSVMVLAWWAGAAAWADKVYLKDGGVREGIIVEEDDLQLRLRIDRDGIKSTLTIPKGNIELIKKGPVAGPPAPATLPAPQPGTAPATLPAEADTKPSTRPGGKPPVSTRKATAPAAPFLEEFLAQAAGLRPDLGDPANLSPADQALWKSLTQAQEAPPAEKKPEALLAALVDLLNALEDKPGRLDALAQRYVHKPYARWLAETRWDVISPPQKMKGGNFDLRDVTDYERTALSGVMRAHTRAALDPLRPFVPKPEVPVKPGTVKPKPGVPPPKPPDPLAGITTGNAEQVRDQATLALALLEAESKLEPNMSEDDKAFVAQERQWIIPIRIKANQEWNKRPR